MLIVRPRRSPDIVLPSVLGTHEEETAHAPNTVLSVTFTLSTLTFVTELTYAVYPFVFRTL